MAEWVHQLTGHHPRTPFSFSRQNFFFYFILLTLVLRLRQVSSRSLTMVIEPELVGALQMVAGGNLSLLQAYGISRMAVLTPDNHEYEDIGLGGVEYVVYVVRPVPTWMRVIAGHVQQHARLNHTWPTTRAAAASPSTSLRELSYLTATATGSGTRSRPLPWWTRARGFAKSDDPLPGLNRSRQGAGGDDSLFDHLRTSVQRGNLLFNRQRFAAWRANAIACRRRCAIAYWRRKV